MTLRSQSAEGGAVAFSPTIQSATYPADLQDCEQWLAWKESDGRKIPRAPHAYPAWPDRYVDAQNPEVWTSFDTARSWCSMLTGYDLAFSIRDRGEYPGEDLVLVDYDDVFDCTAGRIHPTALRHVDRAGTYTDISPSGSGIHLIGRGCLPDDVQAITAPLPDSSRFPSARIEVYDSARYIAMSGKHLACTPVETRDIQAFIDEVSAEYATTSVSTSPTTTTDSADAPGSGGGYSFEREDSELVGAIRRLDPGDIRLWSPVTEVRSDGTKSRDPVWVHSESGTRLAELDDGWVYRDGLVPLDALQVVALEEGIITDERSYPKGRAFWRAVSALTDRGANLPRNSR